MEAKHHGEAAQGPRDEQLRNAQHDHLTRLNLGLEWRRPLSARLDDEAPEMAGARARIRKSSPSGREKRTS